MAARRSANPTLSFGSIWLFVALSVVHAWSQGSPAELASTVVKRWVGNSDEEIAAVFSFREGRDAFGESADRANDRIGGLAKVVHQNDEKAVLLISGVSVMENSGD